MQQRQYSKRITGRRQRQASLFRAARRPGRGRLAALLSAAVVMAAGVLLLHQQSYASSEIPVTGYATVLMNGDKLDFDDPLSYVTIDSFSRQMNGYVWNDDAGWISFGANGNPNGPVAADASGVLGGKAKSLNAGELDFSGSGSQVIVSNGSFSGYVWSDDVGWIDFSHVKAAGYNTALTPQSNAGSIKSSKNNGYFGWVVGQDSPSDALDCCLNAGDAASGPHPTLKDRPVKPEANNDQAEPDKTSRARRDFIASLTDFVVESYRALVVLVKPWMNVIVPVAGLSLSTLTIAAAKAYWVKRK